MRKRQASRSHGLYGKGYSLQSQRQGSQKKMTRKRTSRIALCSVGGAEFPEEYRSWQNAKRRCFDEHSKDFPYYGGRGITMCEDWQNSFASFLADVGPKSDSSLTLDRIDNGSHYEPGNCRWDSYWHQTRNRRSNVMLTHDGMTLCLNDWAALLGMKRMTLTQRLRRGWSVSEALTIPVHGRLAPCCR